MQGAGLWQGEWRPVAFFNEKRDLAPGTEAILKSPIRYFRVHLQRILPGGHSTVQLTTKYPVGESIDAYNSGKSIDQIDVNVNAPSMPPTTPEPEHIPLICRTCT